MHPAGTIDVLDTHRFDVDALERYLTGHLAGFTAPISIRQFRGGQSNPTYYLRGADPPSGGMSGADPAGPREYVLRRKPTGHLLPSAHAVDREYRVMTALQRSGVPVPKTHLLCEDANVIGTPFFLMEYVAGHPMTDASLPNRSPAERRAIYESIISRERSFLLPSGIGKAKGSPRLELPRNVPPWRAKAASRRSGSRVTASTGRSSSPSVPATNCRVRR